MDIEDFLERIVSKEDFIVFLDMLNKDFKENKEKWANRDMEDYIFGMQRFLSDHTERSLVVMDFTPSWKLFANLMIGASIYE